MFAWCFEGRHKECHREFEKFYIDPKTNKPVMTGVIIRCQCRKRGCSCYIKPAERPKPKKRTVRKKK